MKVYDRGISVEPSPENVYQMLVGYRVGRHVGAASWASTEALSVEAAHFVDVCQAQRAATARSTDGGCSGLSVDAADCLEAGQRSTRA